MEELLAAADTAPGDIVVVGCSSSEILGERIGHGSSFETAKAVLEGLQARILFAGVAQKPGSPMVAARMGDKLVFCLSGNPFAAAATLEQYAVPALLRAAGRREEECILPRTTRTLTTGFSKSSKGTRFLRAKAEGGAVAIPGEGNAEVHSSGSLSAMIGCNCLVELPAGSGPVQPGEQVEVLSFVQ